MHIYTSYFIKTLFLQFMVILLTLTGIVWITQSMRIIDLIVNKGISLIDFIKISGLLIPYMIFIITPIAVFFSCIVVMYRLIVDKEIIILKAAGLSNFQLIKPVIYFSIGVTIFTYFISIYLLPLSYGKFKDLQIYFRQHYASILLEEGIFSTQVNNLTVYVDNKVDNVTYQGIMVYDTRRQDKPKVIFAEEGKITGSSENLWFELYNGSHQEISANDGFVLYFEKYEINLNIFTEEYTRSTELNEKYINELFGADLETEPMRDKFNVHGHFRLSWPLSVCSLALLAASILITREYQRKAAFYKNILLGTSGIVITIIYVLVNNYALNYQKLALMLYAIPIATIIYAISLALHKAK